MNYLSMTAAVRIPPDTGMQRSMPVLLLRSDHSVGIVPPCREGDR
jgi:hypothetical protein